MGLFDKIKSAANFITGGGATVTVTPVSFENDGKSPITVKVNAVVKEGTTLNATKIYLDIRAEERVSGNFNTNEGKKRVSESVTTYKAQVEVAPGQTLEASQSYDWECSFSIPHEVSGTFHGQMASHVIEVRAGLDVKGNDPDSGWVEIRVAK